MELKKIFKNSLKRNEIKYFNKIYDKANSEILDVHKSKNEVLRNKRALKNLNIRYPFIYELAEVLCSVKDKDLRRKIIVDEIIEFLTLIYQTDKYTVKDGDLLLELKSYIEVKNNLSYDLPQILSEMATFKFLNSTKEQKFDEVETASNDSLSKLKDTLSKCELFDNHKNTFYLQNYENVTSLQSFQYLMCFYILEVLGKGINEVNKTELYTYFNKTFNITRRNKTQLMTTKNWDNFKTNRFYDIANSQFYIDISKELKNLLGLPTRPSRPS